MSAFNIRVNSFFDRPAMKQWIDEKNRKALGRTGGIIRKVARQSIRPSKAISKPGSPPNSHTGDLRRIIFGLDHVNVSVLIGPMLMNSKTQPLGGVTVGQTLEQGLTVRVPKNKSKKLRRLGKGAHKFSVVKRYKKHPYMLPALMNNLHRIPENWSANVG